MFLTTDMINLLNQSTIYPRWLAWFKVKEISSGNTVYVGIWNDVDTLNVNINGENRTYVGGGSLLEFPSLSFEKGLDIQTQSIALSMLAPEAVTLFRLYDTKFGKIEIHLALIDSQTNSVAATARAFSGIIDGLDISESEDSINATCTIVSSIRAGTRTLSTKQSDASQKLRNPTDTGRIYADITKAVPVTWGQNSDKVPNFAYGSKSGNVIPSWFTNGSGD